MSRKNRLSPDDWLRAGLNALSASGPEALKAEPLARALDTTKGSFYWHFPDVPAFRQALLDFWGQDSLASPETPGDKREAVAQLHALVRDGFSADPLAEAAMRAWARTDATAKATLEDIDARRLAHLEGVLKQIGVTNPDIARMLYAARIGMGQLGDSNEKRNNEALDTLVDLVLALR
ncbi:TetR/AcrR family transcriptional regulator [Pseudooceanicola spongiae]|jgi:AcrR family transcriptional regulator|uniref:TetR family transcriptional regulator n=1 Tax=Pseudooceanicola spongiae TaxID=2613965 RepID=A0A7L9WPC7_9RHOB|nr:TetR/AcrR family transcriptional regulator [Pseudooceanicola spongiae]QOL81782.1 TetR family transcriptional regulator [Pseudooceanicola spongiae]